MIAPKGSKNPHAMSMRAPCALNVEAVESSRNPRAASAEVAKADSKKAKAAGRLMLTCDILNSLRKGCTLRSQSVVFVPLCKRDNDRIRTKQAVLKNESPCKVAKREMMINAQRKVNE